MGSVKTYTDYFYLDRDGLFYTYRHLTKNSIANGCYFQPFNNRGHMEIYIKQFKTGNQHGVFVDFRPKHDLIDLI